MAWEEGPQEITFRSEENAWILSAEDYRKLKRKKESIVDFFQKSPHREIDLEFDRRKDLPRDVELYVIFWILV